VTRGTGAGELLTRLGWAGSAGHYTDFVMGTTMAPCGTESVEAAMGSATGDQGFGPVATARVGTLHQSLHDPS
jgi:hypothetical protein